MIVFVEPAKYSPFVQQATEDVWGMLLVHHAFRVLMHQAAVAADVDPDRLSFTRSLRMVRLQTLSGWAALSPQDLAWVVVDAIVEI